MGVRTHAAAIEPLGGLEFAQPWSERGFKAGPRQFMFADATASTFCSSDGGTWTTTKRLAGYR
jgi:hypothetical protein